MIVLDAAQFKYWTGKYVSPDIFLPRVVDIESAPMIV